VWVENTSLSIRFGKIGTTGQTTIKDFPTTTAADEARDKAIAQKIKKGYVELPPGEGMPADEQNKEMEPPQYLSMHYWEIASIWSDLSDRQQREWASANPHSCIYLGRKLFERWATLAQGSRDDARSAWALGGKAGEPEGEQFQALSPEAQRVKFRTHLESVKKCLLAVQAFDEFSKVTSEPPLVQVYQSFQQELGDWVLTMKPIPSAELDGQFGPKDCSGNFELVNTEAVMLKLAEVDPNFIWSTWWDDHGESLVPGLLRAGDSFVITELPQEDWGGDWVATRIRVECPLCWGVRYTANDEECPICEGNEQVTLEGEWESFAGGI